MIQVVDAACVAINAAERAKGCHDMPWDDFYRYALQPRDDTPPWWISYELSDICQVPELEGDENV